MLKPDISNAFANAGQSQKIHHLTKRVEELEAEINQLRAVEVDSEEKIVLEARIQELVTELADKQGVSEVPINLIDRNPRQPRQTFTKASIKGMAELLKKQGQHTPVILIPLSKNKLSATQLKLNEAQSRKIRVQLGQRVIQEKLSLSQTKALVKETLSQYKSANISSNENKKVNRTVKTIRSINFEEFHHNQLEEVRQALQSKLQEIDKRIELSNKG